MDDKYQELSAALDKLHINEILLPQKVAPAGRLFEKGNQYARRYGIDTLAMVCALRHLGCSIKGIARVLQVSGEQTPSPPTIREMIDGSGYKVMRSQPAVQMRVSHYVDYFDEAFKQMQGWQPSASAIAQARVSKQGDRFRGGFTSAAPAAAPAPAGIDYNAKRMQQAAERRATAQAANWR